MRCKRRRLTVNGGKRDRLAIEKCKVLVRLLRSLGQEASKEAFKFHSHGRHSVWSGGAAEFFRRQKKCCDDEEYDD